MTLSLSILFLSASILSFEIIIIRILAISHWQPFVTLAISTALLGYGLSGSVLVRLRDRIFTKRQLAYPVLAMATTLIYRPVIHASGRLHLDPGLIIRDPYQWLKVWLLIIVLTIPFTLASGALALPLLERESVGKYYGWNFLGAALGVTIVLIALGTLDPANRDGVHLTHEDGSRLGPLRKRGRSDQERKRHRDHPACGDHMPGSTHHSTPCLQVLGLQIYTYLHRIQEIFLFFY